MSVFKDKWGQLSETYSILHRDFSLRIKRTLSSSIGCVAEILSFEAAEKDILPVFDKMLFEDDEKVTKDNLLNNLPFFLSMVNENQRENYFRKIIVGINFSDHWRINLPKIKIIERVSYKYDNQFALKVILPILLDFTADSTAIIREAAIESLALVLIQQEDSWSGEGVEILENYALSTYFTTRYLFLKAIPILSSTKNSFNYFVAPYIASYVKETIMGNLITLSKQIGFIYEKYEYVRDSIEFNQILNFLKQKNYYLFTEHLKMTTVKTFDVENVEIKEFSKKFKIDVKDGGKRIRMVNVN